MTTCEKPRCPCSRRKPFSETDTCDLNGKMCLLESATECSIYQEFLEKDEIDQHLDSEVESRLSMEG